jgi:hypothetical protein
MAALKLAPAGGANLVGTTTTKTIKTKSNKNKNTAKLEQQHPRRGRKRGRCVLAFCTEDVCMHCTCDGSCGRGHAPKLCGKRRYEKRANCNQCKVSYYALTKRTSPEVAAASSENVYPTGFPPMHPPQTTYVPVHPPPPPPNPSNCGGGSVTISPHEGAFVATQPEPTHSQPPFLVHAPQLVQQQSTRVTSTFPPKPKREELEKWRKFLMEEPMKIVVWEDVKEAINEHAVKDSPPMSNSSSEADLTSLALVELSHAAAFTKPFTAGSENKMFDRALKDCDNGWEDRRDEMQGSFSSIDDEEEDGLLNSLLDDMEAQESEWTSSFGRKEGSLKVTEENVQRSLVTWQLDETWK